MVIIVNYHPTQEIRVRYTSGPKIYMNVVPPACIAALKGLDTLGQIVNTKALSKTNATIYHYETNAYLQRATKLFATNFPLVVIGSQGGLSSTDYPNTSYFSGTTVYSGVTLSSTGVTAPNTFTLSVSNDTSLASSISATSVGNASTFLYNSLSGNPTTNLWEIAVSAFTTSNSIYFGYQMPAVMPTGSTTLSVTNETFNGLTGVTSLI